MNSLDRKILHRPDGLERNNNSLNTIRNSVCKNCTRLFYFSFAFVLTKKLPELRICFGLYATIAMRAHRTISVAFAYQDNPSSLTAHRLLLLPPKLRIWGSGGARQNPPFLRLRRRRACEAVRFSSP